MQDYIKIHEKDNVAVALKPLSAGTEYQIDGVQVVIKEEIMQGHKFALKDLEEGEKIIKYGYPIGYATSSIRIGEWVHTHKIKTTLGEKLEYTYEKVADTLEKTEEVFFDGFVRDDGKVAIRNEIWIIPTVGCVNSVVNLIEKKAQSMIRGSVESILAFNHPYGCSQMGDDQENTRQILANLANHPNAGGVLVLGLGCENSSVEEIKKHMGSYDENRVRFLIAQDVEDEVEASLEIISELVEYASKFERQKVSASKLVIGMKCGGSDGLSGITANTTVGAFSDILVSKGGTTILTEVPEMFGAETLLMNRCETEDLFHKTERLINDFKDYFTEHHQTIYENPSPGNKKGGISTLEDKSLGCTQKSGSAVVRGVLGYGEMVDVTGLNLLSAPGNDLVASTALAAAGAHMVLFTTGRGTPFACPVPTAKISSNTNLYDKKRNWIDFNTGRAIEDSNVEEMAKELFDYVIRIASGEQVKSEEAGYHDMAIFKQGVTL